MLAAPREFRPRLHKVLTILACALGSIGCASRGATTQRQSDFLLTSEQGYAGRGWIGIRIDTLPNGNGVRVTGTVPRSPATAAGIRPGDQLTQADGRALEDPDAFVRLIRSREPGSRLTLVGYRDGQSKVFDLKIESSPDENGVLERTLVNLPAPALDGLASLTDQAAPNWPSLRGHIVVLDFWAPWCGVCHLVTAELNRWQQRFGERVTVIGIAAGSVSQIARSAPRFNMQYRVLADPEERVARAFDAFAVPLVLVVDASGVVRAVSLGYSSLRLTKMEQLVERLLIPS